MKESWRCVSLLFWKRKGQPSELLFYMGITGFLKWIGAIIRWWVFANFHWLLQFSITFIKIIFLSTPRYLSGNRIYYLIHIVLWEIGILRVILRCRYGSCFLTRYRWVIIMRVIYYSGISAGQKLSMIILSGWAFRECLLLRRKRWCMSRLRNNTAIRLHRLLPFCCWINF